MENYEGLSWVVASLDKSPGMRPKLFWTKDLEYKCTHDLATCGTTSSNFGIVAAYDANNLLPKNLFIKEKCCILVA
jgi:hypothetical protein